MDNKQYIDKLIDEQRGSSKLIQTRDLKNRFIYPFFPTIVVDNFYQDPDLVRKFALDQEFFKGERGSWPGIRTELLHRIDNDFFKVFSKKMWELIKPYGFMDIVELQTGFQLIDETYGRGWVHDDDPSMTVAGVVYLSPNSIEGSGTTIYNDAPDFNGEVYSELFMNDVLVASAEERAQFAKYRAEQVSHFKPNTIVDNVYNRLVLFDSRCWHSADNFFGTTKEDTRLTQVFFIKLA
jgi:hypothetical protein